MMHGKLVLRTLLDGLRHRARPFVPARLRPYLPLRNAGRMDVTREALERHLGICEWLVDVVGGPSEFSGWRVCEIGPGDCRVTQVLLAQLGAKGVEVVEPGVRPALQDDAMLLHSLVRHGILSSPRGESERAADGAPVPTTAVVTWPVHAERLAIVDRWDVAFSYAVLEHVEDLPGFMRACFRGLRPGASMHHMIDFTGHAAFEDPVPPLDFQTYPDWLWRLMYPPGGRNTRRHASEFVRAARAAGFEYVMLRRDQTASPDYMNHMWGQFNGRFRRGGPQDADMLCATLSARKPEAHGESSGSEARPCTPAPSKGDA